MKRRITTTPATLRLRRTSTRFSYLILGCALVPQSNALAQEDDTSSSDPSDDTSSTDEGETSQSGDPDSVRLEILYKPVSDLQIAVWLEDSDGEHLRDIFVTQATGTLGIGNRPGIWNFLSSWRAPYGPRPSVLPVWAHRRTQRYPKVVFHDAMTTDSLGFHERTSSAENYFCRPLTQSEQDAIIDTMTCPSPQVFQTDKGRFDPKGDESVYPPRNDLVEFEDDDDHADAQLFDQLNDLDSISGATPTGNQIQRLSVTLSRADLDAMGVDGKIYAWIEANLENDQNDHFSFDREKDHFVDVRLREYGVPYLGQPAVSYRVEIDPKKSGIYSTDAFAGYADWDGKTGTLHPADGKISTNNGSGAGRLLSFKQGEETARVFVQVDAATDSDETGCTDQSLPAVQDLRAHADAFDRVRLSFRVPDGLSEQVRIAKIRARYQHAVGIDEFDASKAVEASSIPPMCIDQSSDECMTMPPGERREVTIDSLWGNYTYTFSLEYEDRCGNKSELRKVEITTPTQEFQQLESYCFVATAAYGASWIDKVWGLRSFRDAQLRPSPLGRDLISFYYAFGPALAEVIDSNEILRTEARSLLEPMARAALQTALASTPTSPTAPTPDEAPDAEEFQCTTEP